MKRDSSQISSAKLIKLLIASEGMPTYSEGLRLLLEQEREFEVVGIAYDGEEILTLAKTLQPDIIILGIDMPKMNGIEVTKQIRSMHLHSRILIITSCSEDTLLLAAMEAGSDGCISMGVSKDQLVDSLRSIHFGEILFESRVAPSILKSIRDAAKVATLKSIEEGLSKRETEILRLASKGMTNKEIGSALYLSERTVQAHLAVTFGKLGVNSRTEAVAVAIDRGLLSE